MSQECVPEELENHPVPDALVWMALWTKCEFGTLQERTRLSSSTLSDALRRLREAGLVKKEPHPSDGRKWRYERARKVRDSE